MKNLKWTVPLVSLVATSALVIISAGCSNQATTPRPDAPAAKAPATNVLYTCSMHPEFVTNQPGNCPICGMQLVPKK